MHELISKTCFYYYYSYSYVATLKIIIIAEFHKSCGASLGQAKLIHSLSSGIFEKVMRAGGHFSYFIKIFKHLKMVATASRKVASYVQNKKL